MVRQLNPKEKIEDLFKTIESSKEYQSYLNIKESIEKNEEINNLVKMIKRLQQKSVRLEHENNPKYKEVDKQIEEKVNKLNSIPLYKEYISRMNKLNDILSSSSKAIENYINSKI